MDVLSQPSEVIQNSAISVADGISAPLLLLHAENDKGCPIEQSEQLFIRLRHWGKVVRMIRFPDSSHVIASPYQLRERLRFTSVVRSMYEIRSLRQIACLQHRSPQQSRAGGIWLCMNRRCTMRRTFNSAGAHPTAQKKAHSVTSGGPA